MKVLIIPEDFVKDQYVLKPILTRMLQAIDGPPARVTVCQNPRLRGIAQALDGRRIAEILALYPMVDLFLLCVDRDGEVDRKAKLEALENRAGELASSGQKLFAEHAWQEI